MLYRVLLPWPQLDPTRSSNPGETRLALEIVTGLLNCPGLISMFSGIRS